MFRPYKVILRPSKKADPRVVYDSLQWNINNSLIGLLGRSEDDLIRSKHVTLTIQWNINNSWICLLGVPEDDIISSKHVALTKQWNINNSWICLLVVPEEDLIRSKHVAMTKQRNINNSWMSSWSAWGWPYKVETCRPDKIYYFCIYINKALGYRLTCCIYML